ncbi:MAG: TIR domain-containing protein, partial [Candidatus Lokiarchaeota archaeon]|nr:TIR domain-containing protein [Candidatus Lokiarchaeota archaeon]
MKTKIFLSHSSKDKNFVEELANKLTNEGYSVWYDDWEIKIGDSIVKKINEGISESNFLIIVFSKNSVNSKWVQEELNAATFKNVESIGAFLLPILIDECEIPSLLLDKKYADFSKNYDIAYRQLIEAINHNTIISENNDKAASQYVYKPQKSFRDSAAEIYQLLNYSVEKQKEFSGRKFDLFLVGNFGDITITRCIDCISEPFNTNHLDTFSNKLRLAQNEKPNIQGTIVSNSNVSQTLIDQANKLGVQIVTYQFLSSQLFDGINYAKSIIKECETNDTYVLDRYVEQYIGYDVSSEDIEATEFIGDWLNDKSWNQLTLLGDLGTGKTFLSRMLTYRLAKSFVSDPINNPLPIRIDLRKTDREFSLEGIILTHFSRSGLSKVTFDIFNYSLSNGNIILILDGFDEMSTRVTPIVTNRNFHELIRSV